MMELNHLNSLAFLTSVKDHKLYKKMIDQLCKDFIFANIDINFLSSEDLLPKDLIASLREKIYQLLLERFTEYVNLLYVVDIPEKALENIKVTDAVEVADQVTFLVLKREWQKVWYKNEYSN